ncbi:MAG TPA: protein phosphatase 2C domain-containing protein [Ignavibacteriaceae bacterium]|nr:protein phosphatase 2C domain-containing protein [Ignavibacteriaceae bacterium]
MIINYILNSQTGLIRTQNEDAASFYDLGDSVLAIVCDGIGGNKAGNIASQLVIDSIYPFFQKSAETDPLKKIEDAAIKVNELVINAAETRNEYEGMATTAEILYIKDAVAYWGHVGDSSIYYFQNEDLIKITKDHSIVQKLMDLGAITAREAKIHPHKNIVLRAIGDKTGFGIDLNYMKLKTNKKWKFILCTDGVTGVIDKDELKYLLIEDDLEGISEKIEKMILERGAPDNYTYIIVSNKGLK